VPLPVAWPGGLPCPWTRGDPEGDKRSVTEIVADEVEASLKWATAKLERHRMRSWRPQPRRDRQAERGDDFNDGPHPLTSA
jgi:hypothetical protein